MTRTIGAALARTLCRSDETIWLSGELGAGKTTFVQGFARGLGITEQVTSPTFALENRYGQILLHSDLFRLEGSEAERLLEGSTDFPGIRIVEWSERAQVPPDEACITVSFAEPSPEEREITVTFRDLALPDDATIEEWRNAVHLPQNIRGHCETVGAFTRRCAEVLIARGTLCRPQALETAGKVHDLLRFADFRPGIHRTLDEADEETRKLWGEYQSRYGDRHETACARFLAEHGYPELGSMISLHRLSDIDTPERFTSIDQELLFYADKRVLYTDVVSLDVRFDDFMVRYGKGVESPDAARWRTKTKELERKLFGEEVP